MSVRLGICILAAVQGAGSVDLLHNSEFSQPSSQMEHAGPATSCEACTLPMAAQIARLVIANALTPPYAALDVPLSEIILVAGRWNLDFHGDFSEEEALLEGLLGDEANRLFLRRVLRSMGAIGSTEVLSDCCWKVVGHDCFTSRQQGSNCSGEDADHLLIAKRATGECAIIFQQANDETEFGTLEFPPKTMLDLVSVSLRVPKKEITTWRLVRDEYFNATNLSIASDFIASASSGECTKIIAGGFSLGSMLGQFFRADYGTPSASGALTKNCTFGNYTVGCSLYGFGVPCVFYNSTVETEQDTEDFMFNVEDDLVAEMPNSYAHGVYCPSCPTDLRLSGFGGALEYSRLRGTRVFQLRRDLGVSFSPMSFRVHAEAVELPRGISTLQWMRNQSYIDRNESYTNGLLGSLSHPECTDVQKFLGPNGSLQGSTSCGHFCHQCLFLVDTGFDAIHSDIRIPMPPKSWLYDIYRLAKLPVALFTEVVRDLGKTGDD